MSSTLYPLMPNGSAAQRPPHLLVPRPDPRRPMPLAAAGRCSRELDRALAIGNPLLFEDFHAQANALVAYEHSRARNEVRHLRTLLPAEGTREVPYVGCLRG